MSKKERKLVEIIRHTPNEVEGYCDIQDPADGFMMMKCLLKMASENPIVEAAVESASNMLREVWEESDGKPDDALALLGERLAEGRRGGSVS